MASSDNQLKFVKGSAASKSKSLWGVVIGFFAFGALASVVLSRFISSHRLAEEIAFFVALLVLYLVVKPFAEVDATHVADLIAVSGLYLTQLLLSLVMMRSLAIGVAVMLFGIVRKLLVKRFRNRSEDDPSGNPSQAFAAILFQSLLLGAVAFVISELLLRVLSIWQSG
jgi:hypothetical protein